MKKDDDELINFYTLKKVKKHLPQLKDEQVKFTGMPLQQHILMCGKTGSGKSNSLLNYILKTSKPKEGTFYKIFLVYKTYEPLYKFLEENVQKDQLVLCDLAQLPDVKEFADSSEKNKKQYLIIFDDCINDRDPKSLKKIMPYYTFGRKKGMTICFLTQSFFQTEIFIRKQTSWVILNGISGNNDLKAILRNYSIGNVDIDTILKMYRFAKEKKNDEDMPFFKICTYECPLTKTFSKNFLGYLNPADFKTHKKDDKKKNNLSDSEDDASQSSDSEDDDKDVMYSISDLLKK